MLKITDTTFFHWLKYTNNINKIVTNDVNVKLKARTSWNQRGGFMEIGCKGQRKLMGSLKINLKI